MGCLLHVAAGSNPASQGLLRLVRWDCLPGTQFESSRLHIGLTKNSRLRSRLRQKSRNRKRESLNKINWLGREDSNLQMAESKSEQFSFGIEELSEKTAKFSPNSINRLGRVSEYSKGDGRPTQ